MNFDITNESLRRVYREQFEAKGDKFLDNPSDLDGFFYEFEHYGKNVDRISECDSLKDFINDELLTRERINVRKLYDSFDHDDNETFTKHIHEATMQDPWMKVVLAAAAKTVINDQPLEVCMLQFIRTAKIMSAWVIACAKNTNGKPMFKTDYNIFTKDISIPVLEFKTLKNPNANMLLATGRVKAEHSINNFSSALMYMDYANNISLLTENTQKLIRSIRYTDICRALARACTDYNVFLLAHPLAIPHNGYTCGFESMCNGYRAILMRYFHRLGGQHNRESIMRTTLNTLLLETPDKFEFFQNIIKKHLSNRYTYMYYQTGENEKYHTERDIENTVCDTRFMLAVISSFLNMPSLAYFNLLPIYFRTYFAANYSNSGTDSNNYYKQFTPNLLHELTKNSGYIIPIWPFVQDIQHDFPNVRDNNYGLTVRSNIKFEHTNNKHMPVVKEAIPCKPTNKDIKTGLQLEINKYDMRDYKVILIRYANEYKNMRKACPKLRQMDYTRLNASELARSDRAFASTLLVTTRQFNHLATFYNHLIPYFFHFDETGDIKGCTYDVSKQSLCEFSYFPIQTFNLDHFEQKTINPIVKTIYTTNNTINNYNDVWKAIVNQVYKIYNPKSSCMFLSKFYGGNFDVFKKVIYPIIYLLIAIVIIVIVKYIKDSSDDGNKNDYQIQK